TVRDILGAKKTCDQLVEFAVEAGEPLWQIRLEAAKYLLHALVESRFDGPRGAGPSFFEAFSSLLPFFAYATQLRLPFLNPSCTLVDTAQPAFEIVTQCSGDLLGRVS